MNSRTGLYCFLMCLVTGISVYFLNARENRKTGVVDAVKLFNQYNMKKELEGQAKGKLQMITKELDSVTNKLRMAKASKNEEEEKSLFGTYRYLKESLDAEYKQTNDDINAAVWKRLNPLINEYGKKKKLHLIIGANGMGSVLYNDDYYDLTSEVISYVNKKYEEGN